MIILFIVIGYLVMWGFTFGLLSALCVYDMAGELLLIALFWPVMLPVMVGRGLASLVVR